MHSDGVSFGHWCLRSFLGELGDKTFFLTLAFCCWCPWLGIRKSTSNDDALQLALVLVGSSLALCLHAVMVLAYSSSLSEQALGFEGFASVALVTLGLRAKLELGSLDARALALKAPSKADDEEMPDKPVSRSVQWNESCFQTLPTSQPQPEASASYGSTQGLQPSPADGPVLSARRANDPLVSSVLAFVLPFALGFIAEAEDKSQVVMSMGGKPASIPGALCGIIVAASLAGLLGFVLERQLSDQRILFMVTVIFLGLSVVCVSQALVHTAAACTGGPHCSRAEQALLGALQYMQIDAGND